MGNPLKNSWATVLGDEFEKPYYLKIRNTLKDAYREKVIYPEKEHIFNALHWTDYQNVKVVIIGQDPYHGEKQAHGLSFSVNIGIKTPPSLLNIYKELQNEFGFCIPNNGFLKPWADQGVLLLNAVLTVEADLAASHSKLGWQNFTDEVIRKINELDRPVVYLLWGNYARSKKELITNPKHLVLESVHPSPLSANRGFLGCGHFKKANDYLTSVGEVPIDWQIKDV